MKKRIRSDRIAARQACSGEARSTSPVSVLIIDDSEPFVLALRSALAASGIIVSTANTFRAAAALMEIEGPPSYVVSELRVGARSLLDFITEAAARVGPGQFFVATAYPSIASAVHFTRIGVAGYLTKPVSALDLLELIRDPSSGRESASDPCAPLVWPTLDRTVWEYISRVHATAGSMSEAARRLGIDRRSLRRMLAKHPPAR